MQLKSRFCPIDFSELSIRACQYALSGPNAKVIALPIVELYKCRFAGYILVKPILRRFPERFAKVGEVQLGEFVKKHAHEGIRRRRFDRAVFSSMT